LKQSSRVAQISDIDAYLDPRVDSISFINFHVVSIDLPEVTKKMVTLNCDFIRSSSQSLLTVKGLRPIPDYYKESNPLVLKAIRIQERRFSNFYIEIPIPDGFKCTDDYSLDNGVLVIKFPVDPEHSDKIDL